MSYWTYPGIKSILVSNTIKSGPKRYAYITIHPKNGNIYVSEKLAEQMDINISDKVNFVIFDELIFVCKSTTNGTNIFKRGKSLSTQSLFIKYYFVEKLGAYRKVKCSIKKSKSEFDGYPLFMLDLPYRYLRSFCTYKLKQSI